GGNWSYNCCQWIWKQEQPAAVGMVGVTGPAEAQETGWWWEADSHSYKWHGPPSGRRPQCPKDPPHCWSWPLPCAPSTNCHPYPHPAWCCLNGQVTQVGDSSECIARGGVCFPSRKSAENYCRKKICWCCFNEDFTGKPRVAQLSDAQCQKHHGQCYDSQSA